MTDDDYCIGENFDCVNIENPDDIQTRKARRAELVWQAYLVAIADANLESFDRALLWSESAVDALLKWEEEQ